MNSPSNLMSHPDAYGQYYHPTPTPAAMSNNYYYHTSTSNPKSSKVTRKYYTSTENFQSAQKEFVPQSWPSTSTDKTNYYYQTKQVSLDALFSRVFDGF